MRVRRIALFVVSTSLAVAVWAAIVITGTFGGWWRTPLAARNDVAGFMTAAVKAIDEGASKGNAAFVLIDNGAVHGEHYVSHGGAVDRDTLFQVASVSKWVTALGVMTLAEAGKIDLDAPVSRYVKRWTLPPSAFDNNGVTIRRLLSHTAGLTDGLGYRGFAPGETVQTLEQSLTRAADPMAGADGVTRVGAEPGSTWRYSGGGYTLLQLLIEEVSGEAFNDYMQRAVLTPLGMTRSTFVLPDDANNVAVFFDGDGSRAPHYRFAAPATGSLYTSAADLTRFVQAQFKGAGGEPPGRGVLSTRVLEEMWRPAGFRFGVPIYGLGVFTYVSNDSGGFVVGHEGSNAPAINTTVRFDPATGDGIIVLATGNRSLATTVGGHWVFWQTGRVDPISIFLEGQLALIIFGVGVAVILALALVVARAR